jgi:hypothetical protein
MPRQRERERDGRIQVSAGQVTGRGDNDHDHSPKAAAMPGVPSVWPRSALITIAPQPAKTRTSAERLREAAPPQ